MGRGEDTTQRFLCMPVALIAMFMVLATCRIGPDLEATSMRLALDVNGPVASVLGESDAELQLWILPADEMERALDRAPVGQVPLLHLDSYSDVTNSENSSVHSVNFSDSSTGSIEIQIPDGRYHVQAVLSSESDTGGGAYLAATFLAEESSESSLIAREYGAPIELVGGSQTTVSLALSDAGEMWVRPGSVKWTFSTAGQIHSSPTIGRDGAIYFGSTDNYLYAVDENGDEIWRFAADGQVRSSPAIDGDGIVYFGSNDSNLYALDPANPGAPVWTFVADGQVRSSPAISTDSRIYAGSVAGQNLFTVDADTGEPIRYFDMPTDQVHGSPVIGDDGTVFFGSDDYFVYAVDPDSGDAKWNFGTDDRVLGEPSLGPDGTVYIGSNDQSLYALDPTDGSLRWVFEMNGAVQSSAPVVGANGLVYSGEGAGGSTSVYAIDAGSGEPQWITPIDGGLRGLTLGADGMLYAGAAAFHGYVYAIDAETGEIVWSHEIDEGPVQTAPMIGPNGTVYVGSEDNNLYAFRSHSAGIALDAPWPTFGGDEFRTGRRP